jgi:KipI family sensor histidine kinase inhibitor
MSPSVLGEVLALEQALDRAGLSGLRGTVPAYASLLCRFDPTKLSAEELTRRIHAFEGKLDPMLPDGVEVEIPTRYDGPDLFDVANQSNLSVPEVIDLHSSREYLVYCIGFAPGFTYCGELGPEIALPRKPSPRSRVPAGSVGIAGRQTGIYAVESPGGWNLIGRTDMRLFDPAANPPVRFKPGDRIRFVPQR